jgi:subtilisin family serine protease
VTTRIGFICISLVSLSVASGSGRLHKTLEPVHVTRAQANQSPTDIAPSYSHASAVASIIASSGVHTGIMGACPHCSVRPVKVADRHGWHAPTLARGINWAAAHKHSNIVNLSLAAQPGSPPYHEVDEAIQNAIRHGIVVVIAAGNDGSSAPQANVLASDNQAAIRVASVDSNDRLSTYSNHGAWVDVAAPANFPAYPHPIGGTSSATAAVSGVVGLMLSENSQLSPREVKTILMSTGRRVTGLDVRCRCIIDAYRAVLAAARARMRGPR